MPGMKYEITSWEKGVKTKQQKYYLIMFLQEAYEIYCKSPDYTNKVKFSKFCELRPRNVLLMKDFPEDQCKCIIHENFTNMLKGLSITYDSNKSWYMVLCDSSLNSSCWQSNCEVCKNRKPYLWILILKPMFHRKSGVLLRLVKTQKSFNAKQELLVLES